MMKKAHISEFKYSIFDILMLAFFFVVPNNDQPDLVKTKPKIQSLVQDASTKLPISQHEGKDKNSKKLKDLPRLPPRPPLHRKPMLPPTEVSLRNL